MKWWELIGLFIAWLVGLYLRVRCMKVGMGIERETKIRKYFLIV